MTSRAILLFGADGQLGSELARTLSLLGTVVPADQRQCDISQEGALRTYIRGLQPALIVNAAAYTAVDKAETDSVLAMRINAFAPRVMAEEAKHFDIPLVHYSTDYVYAGSSAAFVEEAHATKPRSVYGSTKLAGDLAIQRTGCQHLIFRTSWVYGHQGNNFVKTILRLARTREALNIVADQIGAPTWARLLAEASVLAIAQANRAGWDALSGTYHMTAAGQTSWLQFAVLILELAESRGLITAPLARLNAIQSMDYGAPAPRPPYSLLSNDKLARTFAFQLPDWSLSLRQFFADPAADGLIRP